MCTLAFFCAQVSYAAEPLPPVVCVPCREPQSMVLPMDMPLEPEPEPKPLGPTMLAYWIGEKTMEVYI